MRDIYAMRTRGKPFQKGNPGRPRGTPNRATAILAALSVTDAEAIRNAVISKARAGDLTAAKLVLDRIDPLPKGRAISFPLPQVTDVAGVMSAHAALIEGVAQGAISVDEATAISTLLAAHLKVIDATETEARLRAIEEQLASQPALQERPRSW